MIVVAAKAGVIRLSMTVCHNALIFSTPMLHFVTHNFGVSTDIEKAFLHIYFHEQDRDFT